MQFSFLSLAAAQRAAVMVVLLLASWQEVTKKHAKGLNALWIPATRKGRYALAPLIFARNLASSAFASTV